LCEIGCVEDNTNSSSNLTHDATEKEYHEWLFALCKGKRKVEKTYMLTMLFYRENGSTIKCNKKEGGVILLPS
jgi:hypothetical protein